MTRSNCIIYALALVRRLRRKGYRVYTSWRRSDWGPFPHFLVFRKRKTGTMQVVSYKPVDAKRRVFPPPLFKGKPKFGD